MERKTAEQLDVELYAIGVAIKALRERAGITQDEAVRIVERSGGKLTVSTLSNWERSSRQPMMGLFWIFLRSLGYTLTDFDEAHQLAIDELAAARPAMASMGLDEWAETFEGELKGDPDLQEALEKLRRVANGESEGESVGSFPRTARRD